MWDQCFDLSSLKLDCVTALEEVERDEPASSERMNQMI